LEGKLLSCASFYSTLQEDVTTGVKYYFCDGMVINLKAWREQRGFSQQEVADLHPTRYGL